MVLSRFYESLSWTNKRRVDRLMLFLRPKIDYIKKKLEERKELKDNKIEEMKVEIEVELFPDDHNYIGYRIEKHESGDRIFMIEKPPHPTTCVCDECMDILDRYVTQMRKELEIDE